MSLSQPLLSNRQRKDNVLVRKLGYLRTVPLLVLAVLAIAVRVRKQIPGVLVYTKRTKTLVRKVMGPVLNSLSPVR